MRIRSPIAQMTVIALALVACDARAQSFKVQCPSGTTLHPAILANDPDAVAAAQSAGLTFDAVTKLGRTDGKLNPTPKMANPHIKCQQLGGGDGFATMGDGTQTYLFSFGPLSGLGNIVNGLPGTVTPDVFNQSNVAYQVNPDNTVTATGVLDAVKIGAPDSRAYQFNGAIGVVPDVQALDGTDPARGKVVTGFPMNSELTGHVDPRLVMDVGVMNGNIPAPLIAIDEGDELFLTLTNVGMVMRPDLFEQHTVHFHGYPNASAFYDGVPDASVAINIGGSFTYYYLAPEAGTYMWHCHISPPEHLQMGMVGQLYVRPRQDSVAVGQSLRASLVAANSAAAVDTKCGPTDVLCATQTPPANTALRQAGVQYAYNDGDGSTAYQVEYPIQMHGFDPNFHFVGMTFNPESFADIKDKYFLLNGRSYPDTVNGDPLHTQATDGTEHFSQPLPSIVSIPTGGRALLRFSDLNVTEYHTLASLGIPMHVVGYNARLLRDQDGNNMDYYTNSITLGGGESADVILDATDVNAYPAGSVFYLYTPQLDHLSNDAENFGGMMTEVRICDPSAMDAQTHQCPAAL